MLTKEDSEEEVGKVEEALLLVSRRVPLMGESLNSLDLPPRSPSSDEFS